MGGLGVLGLTLEDPSLLHRGRKKGGKARGGGKKRVGGG